MTEHQFKRFGGVTTSTVLNPCPPGEYMTVAVVGVPRGGTSMVAAVLQALGVDLGPHEDLATFHFEDQTMHLPYPEKVLPYIVRRDAERKVWGWKDPLGATSLRQWAYAIRGLRVICVFRDMIASIQGETRFDITYEVDPRRDFKTLVANTRHWWDENWEFITNASCPLMLVSYERAMQDPLLFVGEVTSFLGLNPTPEQFAEAQSCIAPKGGYLVLP